MAVWHITNHRLYSNSGTNNPVFIVGIDFAFGVFYPGDVSSNMINWLDSTYQSNRAKAGNAVFFAKSTMFRPYDDPVSGGQNVIDRFHEHYDVSTGRQLKYFCADMNYWYQYGDGAPPRGSHTYSNAVYNNTSMTNGSGHWRNVPNSSDGAGDLISTDVAYYSNHRDLGDSSYWYPNTQYGTQSWHTNWLSRIKTGTTGGTNHYDRMFGWHLYDEPYASFYRDYATNRYSVTGHYDFCTAVESEDTRPKMVGVHYPSAGAEYTGADAVYTGLSGALDIITPNKNETAWSNGNLWIIPNMVKWAYSKISGTSTKMVTPWLPGCYYTNSNHSFYHFYASLAEGARGILWYEGGYYSGTNLTNFDYRYYTYQTNVYSAFTSERVFQAETTNKASDEEVFLKGTGADMTYTSNPDFTGAGSPGFPNVLDKAFSYTGFKYYDSNYSAYRYRVFAVNHATSEQTFTSKIFSEDFEDSNWDTAYDHNHNEIELTTGWNYAQFPITLDACGYGVYDIGDTA